jgi:hypothetical protein
VQTTDTANLTAWGRIMGFISAAVSIVAHGLRRPPEWHSESGRYPHPNYDELE